MHCLQCFDTVGWAAGRASGSTFLVPAHPGSPGKKAFKRVCVCVHAASELNTRLVELCFYVPLDTKWVISETVPRANFLPSYEKKTEPNTTKTCIQ